ncbi:hypothetical protein [Seonamhaeicola sp.]|uniref:hypothetical protein n=1 Tax=Seonamhaeicola sp. TaxID=1912245 RepID=UPI0035637602
MHQELKKLTPAQLKEEYELCEKHKWYFYNNYCRSEGMPEYSEEAFLKVNTIPEEIFLKIIN